MKIDFSCALHPDARALQISKCTAHHQLCGPCWTEANKSGHCPCCQEVLKELMPVPICEYRIGQYKMATKFDYRHCLPNELLEEIIKFCAVKFFPQAAFFCRPKNMAILMANSTLNTFANNQLKLKADFYFKLTVKTLLANFVNYTLYETPFEPEMEMIASIMLRNNGNVKTVFELLRIEIPDWDSELSDKVLRIRHKMDLLGMLHRAKSINDE